MLTDALTARESSADDGGAVLTRALATFGHTELRPGQAEVITDIFAGRQVIAVMPTGARQVAAAISCRRSCSASAAAWTLVVSLPLIALPMKDQVDALRARGVPAVALTSAASSDEQRETIEGIRAGAFTLVYVAPERFRSPRFVDALRATAARLALVAIDEAHCIAQWGHDFRPDYRRIGEVVRELGAPRVAAFTATATPEVRADIATQLGFDHPKLHVRGFDRPGTSTYSVVKAGGAADKAEKLVELVRMREGGVALVYAATRKNAELHAATLTKAGMRARVYHAGLEDAVRERAQDVFMAGQLDVIVATNAFGMGVDKSDIRLVVHADIPRSPEAYYQEAGRGGRDGKPTKAVLLFNHGDIRLQEFLIEASSPSAEVLRGLWKALRDQPELGGGSQEDVEARLKKQLGGDVSNAAIGTGLRMLERHGMVKRDRSYTGEFGEAITASRPEPGSGFPVLDVDGLNGRRAETERAKLRTMVEYAYYTQCRRQFVLEYFGDEDWTDRTRKCGACDTCEAIARGTPASGLSSSEAEAIRKVLSLVGTLHGRFGRTRVAAIATGSEDDPRFDELPERGALRGWTPRQVMDLLRVLEGANLVEASRGEYPTISTTRRGDLVAVGQLDPGELGLQMPTVTKRVRKRR